jgi:hypothetical protein
MITLAILTLNLAHPGRLLAISIPKEVEVTSEDHDEGPEMFRA